MIKSSSPHIRDTLTSKKVMVYVLIALAPAVLFSFYYFKLQAMALFFSMMVSTFVFDISLQKISGKNITWFYPSSYVTSVLLYMTLPPSLPLWIAIIGVAISLGIGKYAFGYGNSIFNPALVGRAFLVASWPGHMTNWVWPDSITSATPLAMEAGQAANLLGGQLAVYSRLFTGNIAGSLGETSALALLAGGIFLIYKRIIDWRIPLIYIGGIALTSMLTLHDPVLQVFSGGLFLGAFFMATDYCTIPLTKNGKMIFALGCAILTAIFRFYSSMPEGVMYSILLMNSASPLIDRFTRTRTFGK